MWLTAWQTARSSSARVGREAGAPGAAGAGGGAFARAGGGGGFRGRGVGGAFPLVGGVASGFDSSGRRNQPKNDMATSEGARLFVHYPPDPAPRSSTCLPDLRGRHRGLRFTRTDANLVPQVHRVEGPRPA